MYQPDDVPGTSVQPPPRLLRAPCDHLFAFQGVVYWSGAELPGSSARERHYADRYFCQRCLHTVDRNERSFGNSYQTPMPGSVPR